MALTKPLVPKWTPKPKQIPDATIYKTPDGTRVVKDGPPDWFGQKVREVSNGKWWYIKPEKLVKC